MALDQYSFCPCGSGKKIKFCKCADNFQEMSKVARMMEGEQSIAALDRINQLLKTFPSDAWLHAMKCDLLLRLRETEQLEEASAKFIRLRPDNPLAQMFRSLLAIMRGNVQESAALFLQGVADSGDTYHPMLPLVAANLISTLVRTGQVLPALLHCEYLMDYLGDSETIARLYENIISAEDVNLLARETIPSPPDAEDQPWFERYAEACLLLTRHRIPQSKTKLESLQREFGPVPQILIALLHCKLLLLDIDGAFATCSKLVEAPQLRMEQRVYFKALQIELDPVAAKLVFSDRVVQYDVDGNTELEAQMLASPLLYATQQEQMKQLVMLLAKEEVAPKHTFVLAKPILDNAFAQANPRLTSGWVAYFGRQTDKPARLLMVESEAGAGYESAQAVKQAFGLKEGTELTVLPTTYANYLRMSVILEQKPENEQVGKQLEEQLKKLSTQMLLDLPLAACDGKSIRQVKDDPAHRILLLAMLLHLQGEAVSMLNSNDFAHFHKELGLEQPRLESTEDVFDLVGGASYFWTNLETIDAESLIRLMQSAMSRRVTAVFEALVEQSNRMSWPEELKNPAEYTTLNMQVRVCQDLNQAEQLLERIYNVGRTLELPVGNAVLERCEALAQLGRQNDAGMFLQRAFAEVPNDPYLQQYLQMMRYQMQQQEMQAGRADLGHALSRHSSAPRSAPTPASSGSGLWTPDGGAPSETPAAESNSQGSKLWLPGQ